MSKLFFSYEQEFLNINKYLDNLVNFTNYKYLSYINRRSLYQIDFVVVFLALTQVVNASSRITGTVCTMDNFSCNGNYFLFLLTLGHNPNGRPYTRGRPLGLWPRVHKNKK